MTSDQLGDAMAAIEAGDTETGMQLLTRILITDSDNEEAW